MRLLELLDGFRSKRVAVIGDLIADEFIYGRVARLSREAPVLILQYDSTQIVPGGAGNAANNVAALGARTHIVALAGKDEAGTRLVASLGRVGTAGLVRPASYCTPVKTRILAGGVHTAKQQIVRIDRIATAGYDAKSRAAFDRAALKAAASCDAILLSDYGTGLVTPALANALRRKTAAKGRAVPILVDSRYALLHYRGLTACTPNESEVEQILGVRIGDDGKVLEKAGRELLKRTRMKAVLVTRGSRGMSLFENGRPTVHVPIYGSDEVADVTGAGDTVIATLTLAIAAGGSFSEAARLANYAGGVVVMKRGTATVSPARSAGRSECRDWGLGIGESMGRMVSEGELSDLIAADRAAGRSLAFANGCFDVLHVGHVRYLADAAAQADRLIVAVNDDESVKGLKGPGRPILSAPDRAEMVAALECVDYVLTFADPDVNRLLKRFTPDVHCKGTDYTPETVPERQTVLAYGGRIAIVGDPKDHSTRDLLARIKSS